MVNSKALPLDERNVRLIWFLLSLILLVLGAGAPYGGGGIGGG